MFSFWPQAVVAGYLSLVVFTTPILRLVMIRNGAKGFVSWREFWTKWSGDAVLKVALVVVLYFGGFW